MNKILISVFGVFLSLSLSLLIVPPALAVKPNGPSAANGLDHPGQVSQLYLYEKDSAWAPVEGGAWGQMTFGSNTDGSDFVFNGHGLVPDTDYTLIKYNGTDWPVAHCLASGTSNNGGKLNLSGVMDNYGDKVWLVLSSDVDCNADKLIDWNPSAYLFEYNVI